MRILQLHCDYVQFKPKSKALKTAPELSESEKKGLRMENVLVVFSSFEAGDDERVIAQAAAEVRKNFNEVKADAVLAYPYAHLSSNLARPENAVALLNSFLKHVKLFAPKSQKSPFGYYKEFELKCKGHPLAELSKTISMQAMETTVEKLGAKTEIIETAGREKEETSESLKQESKLKSEFFILTPKGELIPAQTFDYKGHADLKTLVDYEIKKTRAYKEEPPHVRLMKEHHLVTYEPGSDAGNMRWMPKGVLMKRLLEKAINDLSVGYGAMQVETPIMYDYEHPALKSYLNRFPARQYIVKSDEKDFFLRFSACFGQFLFAHDLTISYKNLPLRFYEITHSFRREQSGELTGLKRLRAFTMPDMHVLCADLKQARDEFEKQYALCLEWNLDAGIPIQATFRSQRDFFDENKAWYVRMVEKIGKPVLFELYNERYAYFVTKFEFNFIDNALKASGLSTVQIDVENAERFDISYTDEKGEKRRPLITHTSIPGAIERVVYAILENEAFKKKQGKMPSFPLWLSPTQIRIVPIADKHHAYCEKLLGDLDERNVRVDFDDRSESMQKKIKLAEEEWIPFIIVVGDKEEATGKLAVRIRGGGQAQMTAKELAALIEKEAENKPFEKLSLAKQLSQRPAFPG